MVHLRHPVPLTIAHFSRSRHQGQLDSPFQESGTETKSFTVSLADLPKEENSKFGSTGPYGQVHRKPILESEGESGGEWRERKK